MKRTILLYTCFLLFFTNPDLWSKEKEIYFTKIAATDNSHITVLDINNFVTKIRNDGFFTHDSIWYYCNENGIFPKKWIDSRDHSAVIYSEGFVWGGQVHDGRVPALSVGGTTYRCGLTPGAILGIGTGQSEDPASSELHVWRVRRDWQIADFTDEANASDNLLNPDEIREQYAADWQNWPTDRGAPFEDINKSGKYEPDIDIPGIPGADQTLWLVANDLDIKPTQNLYGSDPVGIEAQITLWGYQRPPGDPFGDITFRRLRIIYKGMEYAENDATIEDMYLCQWSDPDIIDRYNYAGCDSVLGLAYAYNPGFTHSLSAGYMLLQGPLAPKMNAMAQFDFSERSHYMNLPVTSSLILGAFDTSPDNDPPFGEYNGTLQWYNLLQGLRPIGLPWINPENDQVTRYPFSGDPVEGSGWLDFDTNGYPDDRRIGINSGPFTMALGDTQEIITALIGDNFDLRQTGIAPGRALQFLKNKAKAIKPFFQNKVAVHLIADTLAFHDLVRAGQKVNMSASILMFEANDKISDLQWSIAEKPAGSVATMQSSSGNTNSFIPDQDGAYRIQVSAVTTNGYTAGNDIEIKASANQPPEIVLNLSSHNITFGDSILADASQTRDPEQDILNFNFKTNGTTGNQDPVNPKVWIRPWQTGYIPVEVTVNDGFFSYTESDTFFVKPKLKNIDIRYTYQDTLWHGEYYFQDVQYYFCGETLLVCIQEKGNGQLFAYHIMSDTILPVAKLPVNNLYRILRMEDDLLYLQMQGSENRWPGSIAVYELSDNWQLRSVLENYKPGQNDVSDAFFIDDELYINTWNSGQYKLDIMTNPADPQVQAYASNVFYNIKKVNEKYLVGRRDNQHYVINRTDLTEAGIINLTSRSSYRTQDIHEGLMFVTIRDEFYQQTSIIIYDIADIFNPKEISKIELGELNSADWWWPLYEIYWVDYLKDNILALYPFGGIVFFNISDPAAPRQVGAFFTGVHGSSSRDVRITENNNNYYVHGYASLRLSPFTGINSVDLKFTFRDNMYHLGQDYHLYQNYPNPFNATTRINFFLPEPQKVLLDVYNILGQKIETVLNQPMIKGAHEVEIPLNSYASGLYFYRIKAGDFTAVKKMIYIK